MVVQKIIHPTPIELGATPNEPPLVDATAPADAIDQHVEAVLDLAGGEQRPEQHGRGVRRWQHGLRLDPALELLMQSLDGVGSTSATPVT